MAATVAIGIQNFAELREKKYFFHWIMRTGESCSRGWASGEMSSAARCREPIR